jgi:hypothetical protein
MHPPDGQDLDRWVDEPGEESQRGGRRRPAEEPMRNRRFEPPPRKRQAHNGVHRRRNKRIEW